MGGDKEDWSCVGTELATGGFAGANEGLGGSVREGEGAKNTYGEGAGDSSGDEKDVSGGFDIDEIGGPESDGECSGDDAKEDDDCED